ncbi:MAG TPA: hypothetical protein VLH38_00405 [Patescibacteria group bacterium]|nr:hypothetical protein [Patescibacteria group bacterium]
MHEYVDHGAKPFDAAALVSDLPFRTPVVDYTNPDLLAPSLNPDVHGVEGLVGVVLEGCQVDRQWLQMSGAILRTLVGDEEVRRILVEHAATPVNEALVGDVVTSLTALNAPLGDKYTGLDALSSVLTLPSIPEEYIGRDVKTAPELRRPVVEAETLSRRAKHLSEKGVDEYIERLHERLKASPGISEAERELILRRHRLGRDTLLLALAAELVDNPATLQEEGEGLVGYTLPSGIELKFTKDAIEALPALPDATQWNGRLQVKDRVFEARIAGEPIILKERKTGYHIDVSEDGHKIKTLTSAEEFEVARRFAALGAVHENDVSVHWEEPLGYAVLGEYQFCAYKKDPIVEKQTGGVEEAAEALAHAYRAAPEVLDIHADVQRAAKELCTSRGDLVRAVPESVLSFEEFTLLKAQCDILEAVSLMNRVKWEAGYTNLDADDFAVAATTDGIRPGVELVAFDVEYYQRNPGEAARQLRREQQTDAGIITHRLAHTFGYTHHLRGMALATAYVLLERSGWKLPSKFE